ncbi:YaeQ family protein [soil metagenome]
MDAGFAAYNRTLAPLGIHMAPNATVFKVELQVSDMDRHYYAAHNLTLAQHPSETDGRLMVRLLAFALHADERLEFGRGLSSEDEPDLWRRDYIGDIEQWIDLGQPDESRIRKACGRAQQVVVVNYSGHAADLWWGRHASTLSRLKNLTVLAFAPAAVEAVAGLLQRGMRLTAMIQDRELQLMSDSENVALTPDVRMAPD